MIVQAIAKGKGSADGLGVAPACYVCDLAETFCHHPIGLLHLSRARELLAEELCSGSRAAEQLSEWSPRLYSVVAAP